MTRTELIVELEDIGRRVGEALEALRAEQRREDEVFRKIMDAVRDNDEAVTGGPVPCCDVAPDFATQVHDCYVPDDECEHIERCGE